MAEVCLSLDTLLYGAVGSFPNPHPCGFITANRLRRQHETHYSFRIARIGFVSGECIDIAGSGNASGDAYRGLPVRQLSVQYTEGREPSRLRTKTKRNQGY